MGPPDGIILVDDFYNEIPNQPIQDYHETVLASPVEGDHIDAVIQLSQTLPLKKKKQICDSLKTTGFHKPSLESLKMKKMQSGKSAAHPPTKPGIPSPLVGEVPRRGDGGSERKLDTICYFVSAEIFID